MEMLPAVEPKKMTIPRREGEGEKEVPIVDKN